MVNSQIYVTRHLQPPDTNSCTVRRVYVRVRVCEHVRACVRECVCVHAAGRNVLGIGYNDKTDLLDISNLAVG